MADVVAVPKNTPMPRKAASKLNQPGGPGGKRNSKRNIETIVAEVEKLLDFGASYRAIHEAFPHVAPRTLDDYIKRANDRAVAESLEVREANRQRARRRGYGYIRQLMIERMAAKGEDGARERAMIDHAIARHEERLSKIEGNFAPIQVENTIRRTGWESLTPEELAFMQAHPGKLPPGRTLEELEHVT